jgi:hypothetical protein
MSTPKPQDLLDSIADAAGKEVSNLIIGMRDKINEAITACVDNAQDEAERTTDAKRAVLTLPVSIKWDLDTRAVQVSLAVAVRHKVTADIVLDDPAQPNLPLTVVDEDDAEETASDKAALASIIRNAENNATSAAGAKAARKLAKAIREAGATVTVATSTEGDR